MALAHSRRLHIAVAMTPLQKTSREKRTAPAPQKNIHRNGRARLLLNLPQHSNMPHTRLSALKTPMLKLKCGNIRSVILPPQQASMQNRLPVSHNSINTTIWECLLGTHLATFVPRS